MAVHGTGFVGLSGRSLMKDCLRSFFGNVECEIGVERSESAGFVAWALQVKPVGRLDPLFDKRGVLVLASGATAGSAVEEVRRRLVATFGPERVVAPETAEIRVGARPPAPEC
jgi:hypothetical protein